VLLRLADGQVDLSVPGGRVPESGFPLAWCHGDEEGRTFYTALGHFPGPGRARPTCATWPGASPGWRTAPNVATRVVAELPAPRNAAAVYQSPGVVTVEDRPVPRPGAGQVLVRVHHCGICGSDIHQLRDGWGFKPGAVAGHEWTGTIAAVGDDVDNWSVGELVGGSPRRSAGPAGAAERASRPSARTAAALITDSGDGAFAEFILARAAGVLRLPEGLSARHAALAEPLAVALHGITRSGIAPGDTAMVIGAGPIGALTVAALRAMGVDSVTVVEPSEKSKRLARDVGATEVIDPSDLETFPSWEPEKISGRAVHVVLECSGKKEAVEAGFCNSCWRGGVLVMVGAGIEHPTFDSNRMILNELHVCGSFVYDLGGFERALELLASGAIPNDLFIDPDDVPLNGVSDALEALATGRIAGKVMVVPEVRPS
jgi:(R,R)-butanediol dehydrogenase/meso-butanediol dehydrogenase/diacetyl reductase